VTRPAAGGRIRRLSKFQFRSDFRDNARTFFLTGVIRMAKARARHILVDTEEKCQSLKDEIVGGADFADLAKEHSSCPSGKQGGDLGEFGPGMMVKEFDEVVFTADLNSVEGPVQTQFGYHLLEVTSRTD
jgi:peptidyl-prolyl cis-trans isomerase C